MVVNIFTNNQDKDLSQYIINTGKIEYIPIEGGFYGIIGDNYENYDPINLAEDFKIDGLRISFIAIKREDLCDYHMWGMIIELINIKAL